MEWSGIVTVSGEAPPVRCGHRTAVIGNNILIFGGSNKEEYFNDLWLLNTGIIFFFKLFIFILIFIFIIFVIYTYLYC